MRQRSRPSVTEPSATGTYASLFILGAMECAWAVFWLWAGSIADHHWLPIVTMIVGGGGMLLCGFFLFHGLYVMYGLLPAIDAHLDPHLAAYTRRRGDPMFYRFHRLLLYSGSLAWDWAHRRMMYRDYDFQSLPLTLRLPLLLNFYSLWGGLSAGLVGGALMKLSRTLGLM